MLKYGFAAGMVFTMAVPLARAQSMDDFSAEDFEEMREQMPDDFEDLLPDGMDEDQFRQLAQDNADRAFQEIKNNHQFDDFMPIEELLGGSTRAEILASGPKSYDELKDRQQAIFDRLSNYVSANGMTEGQKQQALSEALAGSQNVARTLNFSDADTAQYLSWVEIQVRRAIGL